MNLTTTYLGLSLRNPLIASASPQNAELDHLHRLDDAGIGAVVLPSVFQEQLEAGANDYASIGAACSDVPAFLPPVEGGPYGMIPESHLALIMRAKAELSVPVIASLNGASANHWTHYAALLEEAGADALELNLYFVPVDPLEPGTAVEQRYLEVLAAVRRTVKIPVAVKMPPYFSAIGNMASRLLEGGADGLVIFNRYLQPDIDLQRLQPISTLELSSPGEMRLPLLWIALLAGRVKGSLAASGGVEDVEQVVKYLLAGADTVMTTAAILRHGPAHVHTLLCGLEAWLQSRRGQSLERIRGQMSWARQQKRDNYVRANYMRLLESYRDPRAD
ncbi:Dihydroorotate dehydrogenase [Azotobacter vinelandii CA]|uniref:Dihydroorotate dehydrogenase n=2 Tax=Azotobacter vinelandii TaxID=354 RepID=C1DSD9_AZOVD|nr:dihydroorotate dehydrogenase-like protein [Azotobacter vinelandii]ACO77894.1 Dihydroorotate dehydrogenase [Azotobacter vinelandii DJ]AGK16949.1 Dihydroorotate dehydrogenase [Azotobacter vinelandii CA]AGK20058.1 Dihydroorotate dehydrogenase [Azotobacter vinelandii CA6]SFY29905.1 dihydroorotate dehydrogenase (fumarate) [Azotobacter vinelandii]GLK61340.1 dihydroorotate dehydrogenase [Azotobacter vinelandii]